MQSPLPADPDALFDVVVVGARLAGAATAMLLARQGLRVALIDRSRPGADTLSTHALMRPGVMQLHRWGVLDQVRAAGTPAVRRTTFTYENDVVPVDIEPAYGVDALYAPRRTVLDPILVNAAFEAGAEVRFGLAVNALLRDLRGRPAGVSGRGVDGRPFRIRARFVVGADGVRSTVAKLVHARIEHAARHTSAVTYAYWTGTDVTGYEWVFRGAGAAGAIPTNAGQVCVFVSSAPGETRRGLGYFESRLDTIAPGLAERIHGGEPPANAATHTFHGLPGYLRQACGPGWALVGDAGYWKDPLSAHGMTDALRDAELLARSLIAWQHGAAEIEALRMYHATRNTLAVPMLELIDTIASQQWRDAQIKALLKQLSRFMQKEAALLDQLDAHDLTSIPFAA